MTQIAQNPLLLQKLTDIGLREAEAKTYLSMLTLGETTIVKISYASGIKRSTTYPIIEKLRNLGLVTIRNKGYKRLYLAENPERLSTTIERRREELLSVLPDLKSMYDTKGSDILIKTYEGVNSMKVVYDELLNELKNGDGYLVIGDPERWDLHAREYFKKFIKRRLKIDLAARLLLSNSPVSAEYKKFEKNFKEEVRILPPGYKIDSNVIITRNRVIMHQLYAPARTVVIESPSVISLQKNLFEILWNFCG